jgi:hypothetical protein
VATTTAGSAIRRETAGWVEPIGRVGLASQGVLYAIVGVIALKVAAGSGDRADQHGALYTVVEQPFGRALLVALMVGLALHTAWRVLLFLRGAPGDDDAGDWAKRLGHLGRAAIYATFTWGALEVVFDGGGSGGDQKEGVARVLDWPAGQLLVAVLGLVVIATGLWHASKLVTRSFEDDLDLSGPRDRFKAVVLGLGSVGYLARGAVFAMVGWWLVQAAYDHDPNESGGLDNALKRLADSEHGPGLLRVVAFGVFVFGVYRVVDGVLRKRDALANA